MLNQTQNEHLRLFFWKLTAWCWCGSANFPASVTIIWLSNKMKNNLVDSKDPSVSEKKKKTASLTVHWDINFKKTTSKACKYTAWPRAVSFLTFFEEIANPISILQIKVFYGSKKSLFQVEFKRNHGKVCILGLWPPNSLSACFISEFGKKKKRKMI